MLTITPPKTRDDEIQVDETERDSILLRLSPTRVKANRNAHGFNYIQLIVGMIIFVALSRIVGPPAFRMITRARSTALNANIQTAAETVRNVLAIDPAKRDKDNIDGTSGAPSDTLLAALTDDAPFNWDASWELVDGDDSDTIRIQHIKGTGTVDEGTAAAAPTVDWLLNDWDAVRIQARNQDGAWACALIVLKPNAEASDRTSGRNSGTAIKEEVVTTGTVSATYTAIAKQLADARLRGVWYDSGDTDFANEIHCSPAGNTGVSGVADDSWIPEAADQWTIPVDAANDKNRILTRNV